MFMRVYAVLVMVASVVLAGCGKSEPTQSVAWYQEHSKEHQEKLAECKNNPGELMNTPNCINAGQAMLSNMSGPSKVDHSKAFK
jgi:outer membrane PBP1 activator LpoA protein